MNTLCCHEMCDTLVDSFYQHSLSDGTSRVTDLLDMRTVAQALHRAMSHAEIQVPRVKLGNQGLEVNGSNSFLKLVQFSFYYSWVLGFNMNYIFFLFFGL